ncbi:hypothetical protein J6590_059085 [Homalodisca vitripennis]|nr:hypothetical protein J6590_059085 [Homalodisca vitripennis]
MGREGMQELRLRCSAHQQTQTDIFYDWPRPVVNSSVDTMTDEHKTEDTVINISNTQIQKLDKKLNTIDKSLRRKYQTDHWSKISYKQNK